MYKSFLLEIIDIIVEAPEFFNQNMFYFSYDNDYQFSIQSYFRNIFNDNNEQRDMIMKKILNKLIENKVD